MKKFTTLLGLAFIALTATSIASAATFDFVGYADNGGNHERGYGPGSSDGKTSFVVSEEGIQLTARGYKLNNAGNAWNQSAVYLDHGNAGLGVCSTGLTSSDQCSISSDDNVTPREMLWFNFDQTVSLDQIMFKNGAHGENFNGTFLMTVFSEGSWSRWNSYSLSHLFVSNLIGEGIAFYNPNSSASNDKQFYISAITVSAVPIPAAIWLFGSALFGFVAMRRNTKVTT